MEPYIIETLAWIGMVGTVAVVAGAGFAVIGYAAEWLRKELR
jgi:hypothetical protein